MTELRTETEKQVRQLRLHNRTFLIPVHDADDIIPFPFGDCPSCCNQFQDPHMFLTERSLECTQERNVESGLSSSQQLVAAHTSSASSGFLFSSRSLSPTQAKVTVFRLWGTKPRLRPPRHGEHGGLCNGRV